MKLGMGLGEIPFSELDYGEWIRGALAAFVSGGAGAVTAGFVVGTKDPTHYNLGTFDFYELVFAVFFASGLLGLMNFLRVKPIPDFKKREETREETKPLPKGGSVTTTTKDTSVVPINEPLPGAPPKSDGK